MVCELRRYCLGEVLSLADLSIWRAPHRRTAQGSRGIHKEFTFAYHFGTLVWQVCWIGDAISVAWIEDKQKANNFFVTFCVGGSLNFEHTGGSGDDGNEKVIVCIISFAVNIILDLVRRLFWTRFWPIAQVLHIICLLYLKKKFTLK